MASKIAVYLITGFLGSGKTTFLKRLINSFPGDRRLMILMNEFGEIGIDGSLVEDRELEILEINKGSIFCVCVKSDFIKGLYRIANEIKPDVILIEATGVANPKQLKQDLVLPIFDNRFVLAEQFCIVDAANFASAYETYASVEKQIETATVFIINKTDLASSEQIQTAKNLILKHREAAVFLETTYADVPLGSLFPNELDDANDLPGVPDSGVLSESELDGVIDQLLFQPGADLTPPDCLVSRVYTWAGNVAGFRKLAGTLPNSVLRGKGFVKGEHAIYLFDWVMGGWTLQEFHLPESRTALANRIVVIGPPEMIDDLDPVSREFPAFVPRVGEEGLSRNAESADCI
jgi:G3E family GTPase